jgi:hypothetical protein
MTNEPKPFEVHESGALFHGTKADLAVGDLLMPGRGSDGLRTGWRASGWAMPRSSGVWWRRLPGGSAGRVYLRMGREHWTE